MSLYREIEMAKLIARQRISAALDHHHIGNIKRANPAHNLLEELEVGDIVHALFERNVGSVKFAHSLSHLVEGSCSREEVLFELMEADCEDSIGMEESLLNSIAMMHVDIQVEHPGIDLQQLQDTEHDIVNVAESAGF